MNTDAAEKGPDLRKNDQALVKASDFALALALLTRLPVHVSSFDRGARAAWAYPLVGLVLGGLAATAGFLGHWLGFGPAINALISLAVLVVLTGAMHEDGLADTADGFWGGWDPARRLEIMKDSHIGTYGVIALFFGLSARWLALWMLYEASLAAAFTGLIAAAILSRAVLPSLMAGLPNARASGLSHSTGRCPARTAWLAAGLSIGFYFLLLGASVFSAAALAVIAGLAMARIARAKIGGQTGDVLGATQQVTEIAILFTLVA